MKAKRVALYARCSTREQSTDPQLDRLRAYVAASGLQVAQEYVDHGQSGRKDRRPALDALLRDARCRRFDAVCAVKLDRLARSTRHLTTLAAELEAVGVDLIVTDQAIDTRSASGKLLFDVLAAIAEFEAAINGERTAAGMQAAKRRGARMGRPRAQVDRATLVRGVLEGASTAELARRLGVARSTARKLRAEVAKRVPASETKSRVGTRAAGGL